MNSIERHSKMIAESIASWNLPTTPKNLYEPLRYFLTLGGKRMRPVLTLMGTELFGEKGESAIHAAMGVELFHNFTLIHDDIMDAAPLRRSKTTVHTKWNENIAILSGDVLMVKAYQEICKQNPKHLAELMLVFNKTAVEVCEGQQMDMDFETRNDVTIEEYIEMIRLKTSVLLGGALEMGAIIAGASESDRKKLYTFGQELGLAFQIKDDYLDLYGDPEKFGKQIGGDVISNKKTLLYLLALENANTQQREIFRQLEDESDLDLKVRNVRQLFDQFEIPNLAQAQMDKHFEKGMTALNEISVPKDNKKDLIDLSHYLMGREN
jgi:geranylgeranyl diphosphate synthase type II|tara:strand:+ start:20782 stop:21750 length:969 start_codon:yes stop_codon:yes gene_type:complete